MTHIYTDGSCHGNPGPGGWAFVMINGNISNIISGGEKYTTNNRMELTAVIEALDHCNQGQNYSIYSDSTYVINGITIWIDGWIQKEWKKVKNRDLWELLYEKTMNKNISWIHVRAHTGNYWNEVVDKIANEEAKNFLS